MDPNNQDQVQAQKEAPEAPQVPTPPQPPVEQPAPTVPVAPVAAPALTPEPKKSKKGLIIALAVGLPLLILVPIILIVLFLVLPGIQSAGFASTFMKDVTAGNIDNAVKATADESSRSFLQSASAKLKGSSYKLNESSYNSSADSYYLYTLTGGDYKYARVIVDENGGKRVISSLVYDTQALRLKPGTSSTMTNTNTTSTTTTPATTSCFTPSDYDAALGYSNTIAFSETSPYTTNVHFLADSLEYDGTYQDGYIGTVAKIVTTNPGKDYKVHIYGSVATTAASDASFANQRADKVKKALVAKGVAEANIIVDTPQNVNDMGGATSEVAKATARVVVIKFIPGCNTASSTTSTSR